ncbi:hypothetical protein [Clostridium faecium]|uniref:Uncharacterized protein n=1 Tax=Clostridium faecium TaxID=2762223 RepID=A0ABR8YNJ4_9CLOT|nr:hypothetical protein [Clostridium faecium]MBD8045826.1 hypothetical protein [Clostridium faecium]
MALIDIEKEFPFLNDVKLKNKITNGVVIKSIKFNEDELILLKYIEYINKSFGTYIKQLIERDIFENLRENNVSTDKITNEEYLMSLIEKVIDKKAAVDAEDDDLKAKSDIEDSDLELLGIKKR